MEAKRLRRPGRAATLENTPSSIWLAWKLVPTASKRVFQKDPKKLPIRTLGSGAFRCRRTRPLAAPTRSFAKDTVMNRGFMTVRAPPHANGGQPMSIAARFGATILILPVTIAPSEAGPCKLRSIAFRRGSMPSSPRGPARAPGGRRASTRFAAINRPRDRSQPPKAAATDRACSAPSMRSMAPGLPMPPATLRAATPSSTGRRARYGHTELARPPDVSKKLAEREGFEPPIGLHLCRISSAVHSTTLPPLQAPYRVALSTLGRGRF